MPRFLLVIATASLMAGCATPYQPNGLGGGYTETKIDDTTYKVSFKGNGNAKEDRVWYFWFYRCAEFTKSKGYDNFTLYSDKAAPPPPFDHISDLGVRGYTAKEGGQHSDGFSPAKGRSSYTYIPGSTVTVTTWSASAYVRLLKDPIPNGLTYFPAQAVIDTLKPYVDSNGVLAVPPRTDLVRQVIVVNNRPTNSLPASSNGTTIDDYKKLMRGQNEK